MVLRVPAGPLLQVSEHRLQRFVFLADLRLEQHLMFHYLKNLVLR